MYIFNRTRTVKPGKVMEAGPAAVAIAGSVKKLTGLDVYVWNTVFGAPAGTMSWSVRLDSQAQLMEATEKMVADQGYLEEVLALNDLFHGDTTDNMVRVISGTPAETPGKYVAITQATMANGMYDQAIAWGMEMQAFVAAETGLGSMFGMAMYAGFADLGWLLSAASAAELDKFDDWRMTSADYQKRIHDAAGLFIEGSGSNSLIQRVG